MEKDNIFFVSGREKRRRKIFGEGKFIFLQRRRRTEKEKEEIIWRRKLMVTPTNQPTDGQCILAIAK